MGIVKLTEKDREYLTEYDASRYDRPSVAVDVCVFSIIEGSLCVLLVRRTEPPFEGMPSLPGGFVKTDESLEDAARRHLEEKAGIKDIYLEQLYTFGNPERDPRTRVISVAYVALVPAERLQLLPGIEPKSHAWARVHVDDGAPKTSPDRIRIVDFDGRRFLGEEGVRLAFDHAEIIWTAVRRIRGKLTYTTIAFQLVPEAFTLTELQRIYEIILQRKLSKPAFRRKILDAEVVEKTNRMRRGGHRPAALYRFVRDEAGGEL